MAEIVLDTNILVYLENENYQYHEECHCCVDSIRASDHSICIDEGFHLNEAQNQSRIWEEYQRHLPFGSQGHTLILELLAGERISFVPKTVPNRERQIIDQSGIKKPDRIFVKVAYNADLKILVSDEHEDFTTPIRTMFRKKIGVSIIHSWEVDVDTFN